MEEITIRLPRETTRSLRSEAEQRGVALEAHIGDIIDAYQAGDDEQPGITMEYVHASRLRSETSEKNECEIGSFSYGSKSIISR